jgi:hypothetical protein
MFITFRLCRIWKFSAMKTQALNSLKMRKPPSIHYTGPTSQDAKPRVKPGVWRPEIWALYSYLQRYSFSLHLITNNRLHNIKNHYENFLNQPPHIRGG